MTALKELNQKILLLANYLPDEQESMQRFAQMLFEGLTKRNAPVELIRPEPVCGRLTKGRARKWLGYIDKFLIFPRRLKRVLHDQNYLLQICDHSNALYTQYAQKVPHLVTCHDLLAIRSALGEFPENPTRATGRIYQKKILAGLNRARRVVCVSNATRDDLHRLTPLDPSQTTVIPNGQNYPFAPMDRKTANARLSTFLESAGEMNPDRFILHVGGNQWYKNRAGVIEIYEQLLRHYPKGTTPPGLLLAGKPWPRELRFKVEMAGLDENVIEVKSPTSENLHALYAAADALLFPSLAEGFGWPIIEAQACGCPVVTSDIAPMTEIGGAAAAYVNPRDPSSAANTLHSLLSESAAAKSSRREKSLANAARFSPDTMINGYIEEYFALTHTPAKSV